MSSPESPSDAKFTKSKKNQRVQNIGRDLLLLDPRFQDVSLKVKKAILGLIPKQGGFGTKSFDLIMKPAGTPEITLENVAEYWPQLRLLEMKATADPIRDGALNKFFFGATKNEIEMAEILGEQYLFAFVVLSSDNVFGQPFSRLVTLSELRNMVKTWRTQYQVNFRSDMPSHDSAARGEMLLVLGQRGSSPPPPPPGKLFEDLDRP